MKLQPLLLAVTVINLGMFGYVVQGAIAAPGDDGILRGKGLQIVDNSGQVQPACSILPRRH